MVTEYIPEEIVSGHRLGRSLNHDPRSRSFPFQADPTSPLTSVKHTFNVGVLNQGGLGACVAYTGTEILASAEFWKTLTADEQYALGSPFAVDLYREITRNDPFDGAWEPDDTGTDGLSLAKVLTRRGLISGYQHTFDPFSALAALQIRPLAVGILWLTGCDRPDADGLISYSGSVRGGHEITAFGYDADRQWVWFLNHWTERWGRNGTFAMTVADFARALENQGDVTVMIPRTQPAPKPQPVVDIEFAALVAAMKPWAGNPHGWAVTTQAAKIWNAYVKTKEQQ